MLETPYLLWTTHNCAELSDRGLNVRTLGKTELTRMVSTIQGASVHVNLPLTPAHPDVKVTDITLNTAASPQPVDAVLPAQHIPDV